MIGQAKQPGDNPELSLVACERLAEIGMDASAATYSCGSHMRLGGACLAVALGSQPA